MGSLLINSPESITASNAGLFISRGIGRHPTRKISGYELIVVRSGTLGISEGDKDFLVNKGEFLLLWPGRLHSGTLDYSPELSFYWIHFSLKREKTKEKPWLKLSQHASVSRPERLFDWIHGYLNDQEDGELSPKQASLMIALMLLQLRSKEHRTTQTENSLAIRANHHIATNFHKGIHANEVAAALLSNRNYLGRLYKEIHGHTLTKAIHLKQISEACKLLRESNKNIEEVGLAVGFNCTRNFRKIFFRMKGTSPTQYRKLYIRMHINTR